MCVLSSRGPHTPSPALASAPLCLRSSNPPLRNCQVSFESQVHPHRTSEGSWLQAPAAPCAPRPPARPPQARRAEPFLLHVWHVPRVRRPLAASLPPLRTDKREGAGDCSLRSFQQKQLLLQTLLLSGVATGAGSRPFPLGGAVGAHQSHSWAIPGPSP